jgi:threo-3-hydroxy-L-aspartate ammonia-lyase
MAPVNIKDINEAYKVINDHTIHTDLVTSQEFNDILGHTVYFKLENLQTTGSFKFRGALYSVLKLLNNPPQGIVTYGTGNHAVALAWAASKFLNINIKAYLTSFTSDIKKKLAKEYGAEIIFTPTREEAEKLAKAEAEKPGMMLLPPSDSDDMIAGAGTAVLEAMEDLGQKFDAIFVPIGGGSIASGTVVARDALSPQTRIYGAEPLAGNDAARSYRSKEIFRFPYDPETIADGAKTPGLSKRTFNHILKLDDIFEIPEQETEYWTAWFTYIMKMSCEPTSALAIAAAFRWSQKNTKHKTILVIITGHNLNEDVYDSINSKEYTKIEPKNFYC